ncbi:MAG TPA: dephospho-CoA kinase, partial [Alphaproteobacteria bacterium]|nr:dephospho-CoA kinase [Alphaproteobacteria bacterium]
TALIARARRSGAARSAPAYRASRLVAAPDRLAELEAIVHPLVRGEIAGFFKSAEERGEALAVADIPLLFEGGFDYGLDAVIVTAADPAIQRERALARPGMTVDKLEAILARQLPQAEKKRRATHVIDTSGSLEATRRQVRLLIEHLRRGRTDP